MLLEIRQVELFQVELGPKCLYQMLLMDFDSVQRVGFQGNDVCRDITFENINQPGLVLHLLRFFCDWRMAVMRYERDDIAIFWNLCQAKT